jgi:hypothetical protein
VAGTERQTPQVLLHGQASRLSHRLLACGTYITDGAAFPETVHLGLQTAPGHSSGHRLGHRLGHIRTQAVCMHTTTPPYGDTACRRPHTDSRQDLPLTFTLQSCTARQGYPAGISDQQGRFFRVRRPDRLDRGSLCRPSAPSQSDPACSDNHCSCKVATFHTAGESCRPKFPIIGAPQRVRASSHSSLRRHKQDTALPGSGYACSRAPA